MTHYPMFRFTIRDVLWLTVVVALAVGWALEHRERLLSDALAEHFFQSQLKLELLERLIENEGYRVNYVTKGGGPQLTRK